MNFLLKSVGVIGLIMLQSCGGDGSNPFIAGGSDGATELRIGSGVGTSFIEGAIGLSEEAITEGNSSTLTVNFVDSTGNLTTAAGTVTFDSTCISSADASLSANDITISASSVTTVYTDSNCNGADAITATAQMSDGSILSATGTVTVSEILRIGSGSGSSFDPGVISVATPEILSGGSTSLTVSIVDANNVLITTNATVLFTSTCQSNNLATLSSPVPVFDGEASTVFQDQGCIGEDLVTATIQGATSLTAFGRVTVLPLRLGSGSGSSFKEFDVILTDGLDNVIPNDTINSGGSAIVSVNIVDSNGDLYLSPVNITFYSTCSTRSSQEAQFIPPSLVATKGTASAIYNDNGCPGSDFIQIELDNKTSASNPIVSKTIIITPLRIGADNGNGFTDGEIKITPSLISEAESTVVSVDIVDSSGAPFTTSTNVSFSSTCANPPPTAPPAPPATPTASFSTTSVTNGTATTTYTDKGCLGIDKIIATLNAAGLIDPTASGDVTITPLRIGSGSGDPGFTLGQVTLSALSDSISAGGTTSVSVNIVDATSTLITNPVTVSFESNCVKQESAAFDKSTASTINGSASVTFTAGAGCTGTDTIRAKINPFGNNDRVAEATLTIASAGLGSIQFTSTDQKVIALAGTGNSSNLTENATLTFTVLDTTAKPLPDATVTFSLSTTLGGITLQSDTDTSDANGLVQAIVQSGTVATSVSVNASTTVDGVTLSTSSQSIVISTGLPDQDSFSLSAVTLNPNTWNTDGIEVEITARLSDRYNNWVQDGTNISFTTELGSIGSNCSTIDGACSTIWKSAQPRGIAGPGTNSGRTTIFAHIVGEESFNDADGNGVYSDGDTFSDIPEAFADWDEDGVRDNGTSTPDASYNGTPEDFNDVNVNAAYDLEDGEFNGVGCVSTGGDCSTRETIIVSGQLVLVMAEANPVIIRIDSTKSSNALCDNTDTSITNDCYPVIDSATGNWTTTSYPSAVYLGNISETLTFTVAGQTNYQVLPLGTKIDYSIDNGKLLSGASHIVPNTSTNTYQYESQIPTPKPKTTLSPTNLRVAQYSVALGADTTPSNDGNLSLEVDTGGLVTGFTSIAINDFPSTITITLPSDTITSTTGVGFTLAATATNPKLGDVTSAITWTSNPAGLTIAAGGAAKEVNSAANPWPAGTYTITATSSQTDPDTISIVDSVVIIIDP